MRTPLELPDNFKVVQLTTPDLVEKVFSSLMDPLDLDPGKSLASSVDAEWKQSRTSGVSIFQVLPHSGLNQIYVIPVRFISSYVNLLLLIFFIRFGNLTLFLLPSSDS